MADPGEKPLIISIIGTGEMGSGIGRRLRECGARVRTSLQGRSAASAARVARAGLEVVGNSDELVRGADFVLSIVPPGQAVAAAGNLSGALGRAPAKPMFLECNAIAPATVRRIAEVLTSSGCAFMDAGIIGGPPPADRKTGGPRIYISGPIASEALRLASYGLDIAVLEGPIGAASALKMCYGGVTKGLAAIGAAMIAAGSRNNLAGALYDELASSQPELLKWLSRRIPDMLPKAYRWVAEMEEIADFLGDADKGAAIYTGVAKLYETIAAEMESAQHDADSITPELLPFFKG
ncbi:MAG: DUF1932 domain-containing protein [Candidatus Binataceae bacterium]